MADGNSKRPRRSPHSGRARGSTIQTGNRGARKTRLTPVQKALMGGGRVQAFQSVNAKYGWRGATALSMKKPWDAAQAEENKRLYPHLFVDEDSRGRKAA